MPAFPPSDNASISNIVHSVEHGCRVIISEIGSATEDRRVGLIAALGAAKPGDVLVTWKLDRLGRDPFQLMDLARHMRGAGIEELEQKVLDGLRTRLMDPALCKAFCDEYVAHRNRLRMEHNANFAKLRAEHARNDREVEIDAIAGGIDPQKAKARINGLSARQAELEPLLTDQKEDPILIHPRMSDRYHLEVQQLVGLASNPAQKAEAARIIRSLIERVVLTPVGRKEVVVDIVGDLAGILSIANGSRSPQKAKGPSFHLER